MTESHTDPVSPKRRPGLALLLAASLIACQGAPTPGPPTPGPTAPEATTVTSAPGPSPEFTPPADIPFTPGATYDLYLPLLAIPIATPTTAPAPPPATAAPPPTPAWPEPVAGLASSKLGLHVIRNKDPFIMEFIRRVHPRVVKAVDDLGWLSDVKAASPETVTIGRINGQEEHWVGTADPAAAAEAYVAAQLERYQLNPGADYWEGWNEYNPGTAAQWAWYAQFEAARACAMQARGLRAAVGGFAVGWPNEYGHMAHFLPALEAAHRCGGILTLHEYNSPTLQCGVSRDVPGIIPGAPSLGGVTVGIRTLRYRFWYEGYLKPRGLGDLPLVISELGIEGGQAVGGPCNDPGGRGWKTYRAWWEQQGFGPDSLRVYVDQLGWYDAEMRQDPYVIGAAIFTVGANDPGEQWNSFDIHDILLPLAHYVAAQR